MTTERTDTRMEPERDVLQVELIPGLPWVVGVPVAAEPSPPAPSPADERGGSEGHGWFWVSLAAGGIWSAAALVLLVAGAFVPATGNVLLFGMVLIGMAVCLATVFTCPRPSDDDEVFWTLGSEPAVVGQCSPSRVTFTGGER